ncbi:hypothetical protein WJX81_007328 [Elliptochloris bilobata]|uniref:NADP-dependent oxidoreductase domain-containing protein n=1 Tax=Elliptochloris bilobata TaxID=381761 RepID=A0AAW1QTP2_9CHLO
MSPGLPRRTLGRTGLEVSVISFGAAPLGGVYESTTEEQCTEAVREAFRLGINFFDTSPYYGNLRSETVLGRALKGLPRDQIYVATKVGRYGLEEKDFDFSAERVTASVHESLARLGLEYLDVVQAHDVEFASLDQVVNETLPALHKLKEQGLVRFIGFTGLPLKVYRYILDRVPERLVDVVLSYCHHTLFDRTLEGLLPYLQGKGVGVINASVLSMGLLTPQGPPAWHPGPEELKALCRKAAAHAAQRGVDLPAMAIKAAVQEPHIATSLVGFCRPKEVRASVASAVAPLTEQEEEVLAEVREMLAPARDITWPSGRPDNN